MLEFKINETHRIHGLILGRMEEMKRRRSDLDGVLKVQLTSALTFFKGLAEICL